MRAPETRGPRREKLSFPTGLLSSLFRVVLPQRALTPSTATRRRKVPRELCLFSSLSTIPTASVALLTRVMPCRGRDGTRRCWPPRKPGTGLVRPGHSAVLPAQPLHPEGCLARCSRAYSTRTSLESLSTNKIKIQTGYSAEGWPSLADR